jgi:hypothetical protein
VKRDRPRIAGSGGSAARATTTVRVGRAYGGALPAGGTARFAENLGHGGQETLQRPEGQARLSPSPWRSLGSIAASALPEPGDPRVDRPVVLAGGE